MTINEKLAMLKAMPGMDTVTETTLAVYLDLSKAEILAWLYSGKTPDTVTDVPAQYEPTQIMAIIAGYGIAGAENQTAHSENGISRTFKYEDMIAYVRSHVRPFVEVI
jgi:hypothetical protein